MLLFENIHNSKKRKEKKEIVLVVVRLDLDFVERNQIWEFKLAVV